MQSKHFPMVYGDFCEGRIVEDFVDTAEMLIDYNGRFDKEFLFFQGQVLGSTLNVDSMNPSGV